MIWGGPLCPSRPSSAICVADALKEGGLGLACFELKLAAPPGSSRDRVEPLLSLPGCSPPPHPPLRFLCRTEFLPIVVSVSPWCCSPPALLSATPCGCVACLHCCLARTSSSSSSSSLKPQCAQEDAGASGAMRSSGEAS